MIRWILFTSLSMGLAAAEGERFQVVAGYVLVEGWINDHGPYLLLVDTGAASSAVTPEVARRAGLRPAYRVTLAAAGGEMTVAAAPDARIRIGGATGAGVETLIYPLDGVRRIDPRIQGVVGQSFLAKFPSLIDYRAQRMWMGSEAVNRAARLPALSGVKQVAGRMTVPAWVEQGKRPLRLVLDTGANSMTLRAQFAQGGSAAELVSNTGGRAVRRGVVENMDVGGIRIRQATVAVFEGPPLSAAEDGVLPGSLFSAIYLDPANNEVRAAR
jgi:predicted aspartyl protease